MIQITPIAITGTSQQLCCSVTENLCQAICLTDSIQPVANLSYSVATQQTIGATTYATIQCVGSIQYLPSGSCKCSCRPQTKMFVESFDVAFVGSGVPTLEISQVAGINTPANVKCCDKAYAYSMTNNVTITATYPQA